MTNVDWKLEGQVPKDHSVSFQEDILRFYLNDEVVIYSSFPFDN